MDDKEQLEQIKNNLSIDQIFDLLISLGADPVLKDDIIMCRTICHGGDSHKLFFICSNCSLSSIAALSFPKMHLLTY